MSTCEVHSLVTLQVSEDISDKAVTVYACPLQIIQETFTPLYVFSISIVHCGVVLRKLHC